jgi:hypothetical protein
MYPPNKKSLMAIFPPLDKLSTQKFWLHGALQRMSSFGMLEYRGECDPEFVDYFLSVDENRQNLFDSGSEILEVLDQITERMLTFEILEKLTIILMQFKDHRDEFSRQALTFSA